MKMKQSKARRRYLLLGIVVTLFAAGVWFWVEQTNGPDSANNQPVSRIESAAKTDESPNKKSC